MCFPSGITCFVRRWTLIREKCILCANMEGGMRSRGFTEKLDARLEAIPTGTPFIASDFSDITTAATIRRLLKIKIDAGEVTRILPGVYFQPKVNSLLNKSVPADPDAVAVAIARSNGWMITASGETALNKLGLSTQVPATWLYTSNGPYRQYKLDGARLVFKRTANKSLNGLSSLSRLVVQALKALGRGHITEEIIQFLSDRLTPEEKETILSETMRVTEWIRQIISRICRGEAHD